MADIHETTAALVDATAKLAQRINEASDKGTGDINGVVTHLQMLERITGVLKTLHESGVSL